MSQSRKTNVTGLKVRNTGHVITPAAESVSISEEWYESKDLKQKDSFLRNLSIASALVLCAVTLRTGALPSLTETTDAVLAAVTDQSLLDENLGKLSFVSTLFPEAVLVFGEQPAFDSILPVSAGYVTHAWSEYEPYTSWHSELMDIVSAAAGEVTGIYHGYEDEWIVEVTGESEYTWLYGNLGQVMVQLGDSIASGMPIGQTLSGEDFVLEVRRNGISIDPSAILQR